MVTCEQGWHRRINAAVIERCRAESTRCEFANASASQGSSRPGEIPPTTFHSSETCLAPIPKRESVESKLQSLRKLNVLAGTLHLMSFILILILILSNDASLPGEFAAGPPEVCGWAQPTHQRVPLG